MKPTAPIFAPFADQRTAATHSERAKAMDNVSSTRDYLSPGSPRHTTDSTTELAQPNALSSYEQRTDADTRGLPAALDSAPAFLDDLFGDQVGYACLGFLIGDPDGQELNQECQEWFWWPHQRDLAGAWLEEHAAQGHNTYARQCLFSRSSGKKQYALPSHILWRDDVKDPRTAFSTLVETSDGNYQAFVKLDRLATTDERQRMMIAWRDANTDSDDCSADPVHFVRLPGGHNRKRGGDWVVRVADRTERVYCADRLLARCSTAGEGKHTSPTITLDREAHRYWLEHVEQLLNAEKTLPRAFVRDTPGRRILELRAQGKGMLFHTSGTWDASRERLWLANSLLMARYTDEQIAALLWYFELGETVKIKGERAIWSDITTVIGMAHAAHPHIKPRTPIRTKTEATEPAHASPFGIAKPKRPRGRPTHAPEVERFYLFLRGRISSDTPVKTQELADAFDITRRTAITYLNDLKAANRISWVRKSRGLLITLSDVIENALPIAAGEAPVLVAETPQTEAPLAQPLGETEISRVSVYPRSREADHITLPTLAQLAAHYLDQPAQAIGAQLVSKKTGEITYRRTAKHFARLVSADYGDWYTKADALEAYATEQERRELLVKQAWALFFVRLRKMTDAELIDYIRAGCRREVSELSRDGSAFDKHQYQTRLKCAKQHLGWRGLKMPEKATRIRTAKPGAAWLPDEVPVSSQRLPMESLPDSLPSTLPLFAQREAAHG